VDVERLRVGYGGGVHRVRGNVSATGVGFWIDTVSPPLVNDALLVEVEAVNEEPVLVPARVRHVRYDNTRKAYYVGAAFVPTDELVDASLYRYVEERMLSSRTGVIC
jgi:c-di-GMP-binding flagellar brake protein YcgR